MAQVTGGLVSIEDGIKKAEEYAPPRKVRVELSFGVGEGEDYAAIFDTVSNAANNRVASLLGAKPTAVETLPAPPSQEEPTPPKRKRRTAAEIAAAGASQNGSAGGAQTSGDPADIGGEDPTGGEPNVVHLPDESFDIEGEAEAPADESFDIEPEASAEPITDADLNSAVQKKNAEIANPNAIRALIGSYNPDPKAAFQLRQIDPAKRAEFLSKLAALTKEKASA